MKYGFFSDVHGDLAATRRALEQLAEVELVIFLGDVAGGPRSKECLEAMKKAGIRAVAGNHDLWDFEQMGLPQDCRDYLESWPLTLETPHLLALHSHFSERRGSYRFHYVHTDADAEEAFRARNEPIIFLGHTHIPRIHQLHPERGIETTEVQKNGEFCLAENSRYLVNVGQGQVCTVVYDSETRLVRYQLFEFKET